MNANISVNKFISDLVGITNNDLVITRVLQTNDVMIKFSNLNIRMRYKKIMGEEFVTYLYFSKRNPGMLYNSPIGMYPTVEEPNFDEKLKCQLDVYQQYVVEILSKSEEAF